MCCLLVLEVFFFFKQKTVYEVRISDWSSDVCSSDLVLVTLLLAFSSTQLLVMSMTAYAMTAHFALNMVWLALFLRNDWKGHFGAAVVAFLAIGLHQLQFHQIGRASCRARVWQYV